MKLKEIESTDVIITTNGKIGLRQYCLEHGDAVCLFITLDQFKQIENGIFKNKDEIELLWNVGVEDDSNS